MAEANEPNRIKEFLKKRAAGSENQFDGTNRRAIAILPEASGVHGIPVTGNEQRNPQAFLAAMEANRSTACLKVISKQHKSRAAILIFQGQLLGALYGCVNMPRPIFHEQAYAYICREMSEPGTAVTVHNLPEPLAIAAGALFHGPFTEVQQKGTAAENFANCLRMLTDANLPGCILVNDNKNVAVLSAYMFGGQIVGLYSGGSGWLPASAQQAFQQLSKCHGATVKSTMLQTRSVHDALALTVAFSTLNQGGQASSTADNYHLDASSSLKAEELVQLMALSKDPQTTNFISRGGKDALSERELFLKKETGYRVNP